MLYGEIKDIYTLFGEIKNTEWLNGELQKEVINLGERQKQTKIVIPTKEMQNVKADFGYELFETIVHPIPSQYVDISDSTATASDVASGKVFYDAEGNRTEGIGELSTITQSNINQIKTINIVESSADGGYSSLTEEECIIAEEQFQVLAKEIMGVKAYV